MFFPHSLKYIPSECPALLIIDGHKAHMTLDVIELTAQNKIPVLTCLPLSLTPAPWPMFGPLKKG